MLSGDIPPTQKFSPHTPCELLHPGLCRKDLDANGKPIFEALEKTVRQWPIGAFFAFEIKSDGVVNDLE